MTIRVAINGYGRIGRMVLRALYEDQVNGKPRRDIKIVAINACLLYTSPSPRDYAASRMPSSA